MLTLAPVVGMLTLAPVVGMLTLAPVVGMLTLAPVQQVGRGERVDPGVSQLTLSNFIASNAWFQNVWQVSLTYKHSSRQMEVGR